MSKDKIRAVYPGTFDPITLGHLDIMRRASTLFDPLVVAVSQNSAKETSFRPAERASMIESALKEYKLNSKIRVETFNGLLVNYLAKSKTNIVVRGLRFISDFEYEFQMALMNRKLWSRMETVFLMPDEKYTYISSSLVKEITRGGKSPREFVPKAVEAALIKKYR